MPQSIDFIGFVKLEIMIKESFDHDILIKQKGEYYVNYKI